MSSEKKCPWGAIPTPSSTTSLSDVMSEQLADHLENKDQNQVRKQEREDAELAAAIAASNVDPSTAQAASPDAADCSDDLLIAQMLQMQFDNEHDTQIANEERVHNGGSKVSVSYQKYKVVPEHRIWYDSDDEDPDLAAYLAMDDHKRAWDYYEAADKEAGQMPK